MLEWGFLGGECAIVLPTLRDEVLESAQAEENAMREMFNAVFRAEKTANSDEIDQASLEELRSEEFVVLESIFGSDYEMYATNTSHTTPQVSHTHAFVWWMHFEVKNNIFKTKAEQY
jgi:hypothetical protein